MSKLSGKKAEEFVEWFKQIRMLLPPKMPVSEAVKLYERKVKEEEEFVNGKTKKNNELKRP